MEVPQSASNLPGSNTRLSSQGPGGVVSIDPACTGSHAQGPSRDTQPELIPQSFCRRPLISTYGWDLNSILSRSPNFHSVKRVHYTSPNARVAIAIPEVERDGNPLIIHGWNRHPQWPKSLFNVDWLREHGDRNPTVRNVHNWADFKISMDEFINKLHKSPAYASPDEPERLYGKDGECPEEWSDWLLHSGAIPEDFLFLGSNDFLKFLPEKAKVQTLMCYMGIGDTFTPFHKDLCASSGQNLMCFSEHNGSSFWFMTKSSAVPQVAAYFHQLGQEVDLETHVVTLEELEKAPFDIYIAEQHVGDLVLVPPRSCHQVVNKGGITIKTSWSRMSLTGLQTALWHELPIYHRVCRQEIYKVKSNIFHALKHFTGLTERSSLSHTPTGNLKQLISLFDDILAGEFSVSRDSMPHVSQSEDSYADDLHCDFCGADIFQSFFECDSCLSASSEMSAGILPVGDGLILCPLCYVEGRTCLCDNMQPGQCRPFSSLLEVRDRAVKAIQRIDSSYSNIRGYLSEQPLQLLSGGDVNIFEAACKLLQKRQIDKMTMRSCRARQSHQVPTPAAIYCKSCHYSRCYTHLLDSNSIHSVDAITLSDRYDGDANWHQSHRDSSQQYLTARQRAIEDEERGSRPDGSYRLAYLAKTFMTCRTLAPDVTKHGWYDRFAPTASIPIVNSSTKTLVGLPEQCDDEESPHIDTTDDSFSDDSTKLAAQSSNQITGSDGIPMSPSVSSSARLGNIDKVQPPRQFDSSNVPQPGSLVTDPIPAPSKSGTLHPLDSKTGMNIQSERDLLAHSPPSTLCSSPIMRQPSAALVFEDDPGELSDLTDLPTEVESPLHNTIVALPISEALNQLSPMEPPSSSSTPVGSSDQQPVSGPKSKPRPVFDGVEIVRRYSKKPSLPSLRKRKRVTSPPSSDTVGLSNSDTLPLVTPEVSNRSLSKRIRKRSQGQGPARLPRSSACTNIPTNDQNPSSNNFLANALNQTFQLNSSSAASRIPTTPSPSDAISPVNSALISPEVKQQYRDVGVQKNLNFARHAPTSQPSEDLTTCIMRLEAELRDWQTQAERYKREAETHRDSLDEIIKRYNTSGPPHYRHNHHLPQSGPSTFTSSEFSGHPRWRTRNAASDGLFRSTYTHEPDHPPIEALPLPSPSSPRSVSASPRRKTPTEPRSARMTAHKDGQNDRAHPYFIPRQCSRRRPPVEPLNGRKRRTMSRGPPVSGYGARQAETPVRSNCSPNMDPEVSRASPKVEATIVQDDDEER